MERKRGQITELAKKIKCSPATISRVLTGNRKPSLIMAGKLARATETDIMIWLFPKKYRNPYILPKNRW